MASTAAARRPSFEKKRSTSNVNLTSNRSSSTINLAANDDETHPTGQHRPHKTKQFVVHAGRHHSRVPSYGRNLNKLSKLTVAHDGTTISKGHHLERGGSNGRKSVKGLETAEERQQPTSKKPAFEIGDSGEDTANEEEEEEIEVVVKHSPVKRTNGLKKSSSTKSLERPTGGRKESSERLDRQERPERPPRERSDKSIRSERSERSERLARTDGVDNSERPSERADPREGENVTIQLRRPLQSHPQPEPIASSVHTLVNNDPERNSEMSGASIISSGRRLPPFGQVVHPAAAPPQINNDYATGLHTPASSGGGSTAYNNQALTSRFIESPGRSGASTSVSPGYSRGTPSDPRANGHAGRPSSSKSIPSQQASPPPPQKATLGGAGSSTNSIPSRTQQKLWLQRQFDEGAQQPEKKIGQHGSIGSLATISHRELERTTREFYNVRRFKDPIGDALERIREHPKLQRKIPRRTVNGEQSERGMGLSQSLNAGMGKSGKSVDQGLKGSRDDSGINGGNERDDDTGRDPNMEALLKQLWNAPHLLTSNE